MSKIKLYPPLVNASVFQKFGANFVWSDQQNHPEWYGKLLYGGVILGIIGHNGLDMFAATGTAVYAAHAGKVRSFNQADGFLNLIYTAPDGQSGYETVYGHCESLTVPVGSEVVAGQQIAISDNRGPYTTGAHLHFHLYELGLDQNGLLSRMHLDNGYRGALDPTPYFVSWGSLVKVEGDPTLWAVDANYKRKVIDRLALLTLGASSYDPVITISAAQLNSYLNGHPVTYDYKPLTFTADQLKDFMRTFNEAPQDAADIYARYF